MKSTVITDLTPAAIAELLASFTSAGAAKVFASAPAAAVAAAAKVLGSAKGKTAAAPSAVAKDPAASFVAGSLPAGWNIDRRTKSQWPPGAKIISGLASAGSMSFPIELRRGPRLRSSSPETEHPRRCCATRRRRRPLIVGGREG